MQGSSRQCLRRLLLAALEGGGTALPVGARTSLPAVPALLDACTQGAAAHFHLWGLQVPAWRLFNCSALGLDAAAAAPAAAAGQSFLTDDFDACVLYLRDATGTPAADAARLLHTVLTKNFKSGGQMYVVEPRRPVSLAGEVRPAIELLASLPGVDVRRALRNAPYVLIDTSPEEMARNAALLRSYLHLSEADLAKVLNSNATLLRQDLETTVRPAVAFLASLGLGPAQLRSMCMRFPRLLSYTVDHIAELVSFLTRLGFDQPEVCLVLAKFPSIVSLSPMGKLGHMVDWLEEQGLSEAQVRGTILRFPNLTSLSIVDNLEVTKALLCRDIGCPQSTVAKLLTTSPDTFGRSEERLRRNANTAARILRLDAAGLTKLFSAHPALLRCDLASPAYAAKLEFLEEGLGRELGPAMALNPMYLTYRLDRIVQRGLYLKSRGRPTHSVSAWLGAGEDKFLKFAGDEGGEGYAAFLAALPGTAEGRRWAEHARRAAPTHRPRSLDE